MGEDEFLHLRTRLKRHRVYSSLVAARHSKLPSCKAADSVCCPAPPPFSITLLHTSPQKKQSRMRWAHFDHSKASVTRTTDRIEQRMQTKATPSFASLFMWMRFGRRTASLPSVPAVLLEGQKTRATNSMYRAATTDSVVVSRLMSREKPTCAVLKS